MALSKRENLREKKIYIYIVNTFFHFQRKTCLSHMCRKVGFIKLFVYCKVKCYCKIHTT